MKDKREAFKSCGRITAQGEKSVRFWVKTLALEQEVDAAVTMIRENLVEGQYGSIPMVGEYKVDDDFRFVYLIVAGVDSLGAVDGEVIVYYTDPEHEREAYAARDRFADAVMEGLRKGTARTKVEVRVLEDKKFE